MTAPRPRVAEHFERMRAGIETLRKELATRRLHEDDRARIDAQINVIEDSLDAGLSALRDIVCDANATLDRIM